MIFKDYMSKMFPKLQDTATPSVGLYLIKQTHNLHKGALDRHLPEPTRPKLNQQLKNAQDREPIEISEPRVPGEDRRTQERLKEAQAQAQAALDPQVRVYCEVLGSGTDQQD